MSHPLLSKFFEVIQLEDGREALKDRDNGEIVAYR